MTHVHGVWLSPYKTWRHACHPGVFPSFFLHEICTHKYICVRASMLLCVHICIRLYTYLHTCHTLVVRVDVESNANIRGLNDDVHNLLQFLIHDNTVVANYKLAIVECLVTYLEGKIVKEGLSGLFKSDVSKMSQSRFLHIHQLVCAIVDGNDGTCIYLNAIYIHIYI